MTMKLKVLAYRELKDFPSGSAIEYFEDTIYVAGDDARTLLITGKKWKKFTQIELFEHAEGRIPKQEKADLEATTLVMIEGIPQLCILGSGSKAPRNLIVLLNLQTRALSVVDVGVFYQRLRDGYLSDLNIEGAATVEADMVLANRGNKAHPHNHLLVTDPQFWLHQDSARLRKYRLDFGTEAAEAGVSGLAYSSSQRRLWITASTEETATSYDDGKIGKSYLGIVEHADEVLRSRQQTIKPDVLIDLETADPQFKGHKIESVCIENEKPHRVKLQLVADNDTGTTHLFRVRVKNKAQPDNET
jgi:hypothetical protein